MLMSAYCNMQLIRFKSVQAMRKTKKLCRRQLSSHANESSNCIIFNSLRKHSQQSILFITFIFHAADRPATLLINVCQFSFLYPSFMCSFVSSFINPKGALKAENSTLTEDHLFETTFRFNSTAYSFAEK